MKTIRFGIIGCGLMGREFASAAARWCHLLEAEARPEIVAACDPHAAALGWFREHVPTLAQTTDDYRELLANPAVEAVYVAVPHHLHRDIYCAAVQAGKHFMGEKPFGIDRAANDAILAAIRRQPQLLVRCSSESPFFPALQRVCDLIEQNAFGRIIEANTGFLHSSDLDPNKPINWKRMVEFNGEYGVLGDLGMHALHVPLRAGWRPRNVRAVLSKIVTQRPDAKGNLVPCLTWDNGLLLMETVDPLSGAPFPWTVKLQRIAPGHKNTWYAEVLGTRASARWSSTNPRLLEVMRYTPGGEQVWEQVQTGYEAAFRSVTGSIFEFGFSDSILQMWAAFLYELVHGQPLKKFAGCVTPEETAMSHRLFTAALESQRGGTTVSVEEGQ
ncbi:MAG TPA: Gfo/Idh/MocA family oxidoreductase [Candidatus Paceibacterota bacterium]|nr:Gfo/Idh/MocA family oxidoreductase [Verrucomicrobiota bacterium]HSA11158.1 Gfo/Idh/MocA family oxidoreductase [Candidatus Paceibacterota bacterium]